MATSHLHQVKILLLAGILLVTTGLPDLDPKNKTRGRQEKVFSLFSIVQFPNEACTSTSGTYSNGTCFTSSECSSKGGSASGNCAAGFGVCCVFSVSAGSSTISQNCTYIVNPNYPSNYAPTSTPSTLSYTISKSSDDICRIRLDYDAFVLTAPSAVQATKGQCLTESMTIATTDRTVLTTTTTYGDYPYLCGTNSGMHSYVDLSCTSTDTATLSFTLADATLNQWKIKVTQYSCDGNGIAAQQGCFQYHTGVTGTIQSYNFANLAQIQGQNYKNCIRQEEGYCCIEYTPVTYSISPTTCASAADITLAANTANRCSGASICINDYILIPGAIRDFPTVSSFDRFCGLYLSSQGFSISNQPITTCDCPFEISHVTGINLVGKVADAAATENGFQLNFRQIAGDC